MPYVAEQDVTLSRSIAVGTDPEGNEYHETESFVAPEGSVVNEDDLAPELRERVESGDDDRLSSLLRHVSESEAAKIRAEQEGGYARVPEHEAEAEVLYQDGQDVLSRDEVAELNQYGDPPAAEAEGVDLSEGREPEDAERLRSTEVDARRRGEAEAPPANPAAEDAGATVPKSRTKKSDSKGQAGAGPDSSEKSS